MNAKVSIKNNHPSIGFAHTQHFIKTLERVKGSMTQTEFGKRLELSPSLIGRWLVGKSYPSYELLVKMGEMFNVSPSSFFYDPDNPVVYAELHFSGNIDSIQVSCEADCPDLASRVAYREACKKDESLYHEGIFVQLKK